MMRNPIPDSAARRLARVTALAELLDTRFGIPGLPFRFGVDGLLGLVPVVGDSATLVLSAWILLEAWRAGVRARTLGRMTFNVALDYVVGLIPLVGDIFDIGWKANQRNAKLMKEDLASQYERDRRRSPA